MASTTMEDESDRSMFWLVAAGVVLFLIVALAVWLVTTRPDGGVRAAAQEPPKPVPTHVGPTATSTPTGDCDAPAGSQELAAPTDVTWDLYGGFAEPSSPTAGPLVSEGAVARCYAHTPAGALLASIRIPTRLGLSGNVKWEDVAVAQVAPGPGRDALMTLVRKAIATAPLTPPGGVPSQVAAFRFVSYLPASAVVAIVLRDEDGGLRVKNVTVVWDSGDWKVSVLPDGSMSPPATGIPSIIGFTEFRGV